MEGSCEYVEKAVEDSRHGVVLHLESCVWGNNPHRKETSLLRSIRTCTDYLARPKHWKIEGISGWGGGCCERVDETSGSLSTELELAVLTTSVSIFCI
jgi:hypothetical protein